MAKKYLQQNAGAMEEVEGLVSSTGASDAGKIPALDGTGKLDNSMMPIGVGAETKLLEASENLSASDLVNIYDDSGTTKCRKADATTAGKEANGFVLASVTSGSNATVYVSGIITGLSGLTGGTTMFLSAATAGASTATAPSSSSNIVQRIGKTLSATEIAFEPGDPITLA